MALYHDIDYAALLEDNKHGSIIHAEPSGAGGSPTDGISLGSQYAQENYEPGHGNLIFPGHVNDTDCSCYSQVTENHGMIQSCKNNCSSQRSICFKDNGFQCNGDGHLMSSGPLVSPHLESGHENPQGDIYFSNGPDPASNVDGWCPDEMNSGIWLARDVDRCEYLAHPWETNHKADAPPSRRTFIPEETRNSSLTKLELNSTSGSVSDSLHAYCDAPAGRVVRSAEIELHVPMRSYDDMTAHIEAPSARSGANSSLIHRTPRPAGNSLPPQELLDTTVTKDTKSESALREPTDRVDDDSPFFDSTADIGDGDDPDADMRRKHPLYTEAEPREDGRYHCPFEKDEHCGHTPTTLKCNYDKFIDSHLKPHRCRAPGCHKLKFSSTACRLRHERETHGSHGHGVRPYLCVYSDCDRSKPGNGFPRSWNCNDHMKRVHGHIMPAESESRPSPYTGPASTHIADVLTPRTPAAAARKRTGKDSGQPDRGKRAKVSGRSHTSGDEARPRTKSRVTKLHHMQQAWYEQFAQVHQLIHSLRGPLDLKAIQNLDDESSKLFFLSKDITEESKRKNANRSHD